MTATTPYRRLQERNKELEEISKSHQKQVGDLISDLKNKEQIILLQRDNHKREIEKLNTKLKTITEFWLSEADDLDLICKDLKQSNLLENADEKVFKRVRNIVNTNDVR